MGTAALRCPHIQHYTPPASGPHAARPPWAVSFLFYLYIRAGEPECECARTVREGPKKIWRSTDAHKRPSTSLGKITARSPPSPSPEPELPAPPILEDSLDLLQIPHTTPRHTTPYPSARDQHDRRRNAHRATSRSGSLSLVGGTQRPRGRGCARRQRRSVHRAHRI